MRGLSGIPMAEIPISRRHEEVPTATNRVIHGITSIAGISARIFDTVVPQHVQNIAVLGANFVSKNLDGHSGATLGSAKRVAEAVRKVLSLTS